MKNHNRGFILITTYMVVSVIVVLCAGFALRSVCEQRIALKNRDYIQAVWLAEAGVDRAISQLPNTPLSGPLGNGAYYTQTSGSGPRYLINSKGGVPGVDETNPNNVVRKLTVLVEQPTVADPSGVTSAITANGDVDVQGSADVNGVIDENNTTFNFSDIFGVSKEALKNVATRVYVDPANNITPVDNITWVDIESSTEMNITSTGWSGSGILVVDGNLVITGGSFSGVIWVIGTLRISGNPTIDGSIFVESGIEFDTILSGNPTVNFDSNAISNAFGSIPALPPSVVGWKED